MVKKYDLRRTGDQMKAPENNAIQLFEDQKIRVAWDAEREEWYFSVQDVVTVLSESTDPKQYIKKMRARDPQLSANRGTICTPVQMLAADGNVAGVARKALEAETGKPVVTAQDAASFRQHVTDIVTDAAQQPEKKETANEE